MPIRIVPRSTLPDRERAAEDDLSDWDEVEPMLWRLEPHQALEVQVTTSPQTVVAKLSAWCIEHGFPRRFATRRSGDRVYIYRRNGH